jgi:hypothetical protein
MKIVTLTSVPSNKKIFFTVPSTGVQWIISENDKGFTNLCDGVHNNGGWIVRESVETILNMLNDTE